MTPTNTDVVRRWMDGLSEDGLPPLELCDERIVIGNVEEFLVRGDYHGHEGVRQWVDEAFDVLEDRRFELVEATDAGDGETVVSVQRALGRSQHTGLPFDLPWAAVWTIRDGKVAAVQGYLNKAAALRAAGLPAQT